MGDDLGQQAGCLLGREVLAARLAGVGSVHAHEVFVGVSEDVDVVLLRDAEVQAGHRLKDLHELRVALRHGVAELVGVRVDVLEEAFEVRLGRSTDCGCLDVLEGVLEGHVQVLVLSGVPTDVGEQLGRLDEDALLGHDLVLGQDGLLVVELLVVEVSNAGVAHPLVDIRRHVLADVAVEKRPEDVLLEVPAVHAASQLVGKGPDSLVQFCSLLCSRHNNYYFLSTSIPSASP